MYSVSNNLYAELPTVETVYSYMYTSTERRIWKELIYDMLASYLIRVGLFVAYSIIGYTKIRV